MKKFLVMALLAVASSAGVQVAIGKPYKIESDPSATYYNLELGGSGKLRTIVTKREGKSGTSFAKREVDCAARTFRYLGDGDSLDAMKASKPSKPSPSMGPLTERSISSYVADQACGTSRNGK